MRPQHAKPARAHGLPKTQKEYEHLPKFRPIIDTTGTTHYNVGKYLTNLLNPLTSNDYSLKDSFDTANRIRTIPKHLFDEGYVFVSFDVVSLFTHVPLQRTIKVILKRVFDENQIQTDLKKATLRKLIKDTCTKTVFSCNDQLFEQVDGVSMGSSMGPLLANIIMTELENSVVKPLIEKGTIKFYGRYVDDTLLVVKPSQIDRIQKAFNKFDKNIKFTVDRFENEVPHFLDIEITPDGLNIFRKDTNTGQYINFESFAPWRYRISWIRSLVTRANRLCSDNVLPNELNKIRKYASWNGFPKHICNSIIHRVLMNNVKRQPNEEAAKVSTIWVKITYYGEGCDSLLQNLERKLRRCVQHGEKIKLKIVYSTNKVSYYTNMKDRTPLMMKSGVVYNFTCPGCKASYIGKTDRNLHERCLEHATPKSNSAIQDHLNSCPEFGFITTQLRHGLGKLTKSEIKNYNLNCIENNVEILDSASNWNILLLKEALYIKRKKPLLNHGLKASRELFLFS